MEQDQSEKEAQNSSGVATERAGEAPDSVSYFLRYPYQSTWSEVSKSEYIKTKESIGKGSDPADFHGRGIRGEVRIG